MNVLVLLHTGHYTSLASSIALDSIDLLIADGLEAKNKKQPVRVNIRCVMRALPFEQSNISESKVIKYAISEM